MSKQTLQLHSTEFTIHSLDAVHNWLALEVVGPLGFSLTGIMANISGVLAKANISIFAISTYDTDYVLVKKQAINDAIKSLKKDGYNVIGDSL
ncbi:MULTISPECIES: ACT domain-containing protein [unclassified Pseudoalteromonas]|uniref:ACT domain-containing protein n=1 Tax=unclassified Pseudoalteromonas TaxID=194690 RepID=UPI000B3C40F1|nr:MULTISPECIES: ACT domain-containing protein [unclassified Pseudoalteromonas]MDN3377350.1 ACT domain-containing protein [Pseudoalteromonas sp. APC 3893]MDN3385482.1 ACT domain-containing protein [Pseudoalteromonas sp. APC 4017]OUS68348.1 hypothetical protein B5G52_19785 [Pseudoalteromonas sp. A601]